MWRYDAGGDMRDLIFFKCLLRSIFYIFSLFFMPTNLILKVASFKAEKLDVLYVYLWTIIIPIKILYKKGVLY